MYDTQWKTSGKSAPNAVCFFEKNTDAFLKELLCDDSNVTNADVDLEEDGVYGKTILRNIGRNTVGKRERRVYVRQCWKHPVPTNREVALLIGLFTPRDPILIGLCFIAIEMCRPAEVCDLVWHRFERTTDNKIKKFRHIVYKPTNYSGKLKDSSYYKEVEKDIHSEWFREQLEKHAQNAPKYGDNRLFGYTTPDSLNKFFTQLRHALQNPLLKKRFPVGSDCFLDTNVKPVDGIDSKSRYRIYLYSLRKFAATFHYYVTFKQDIVALAHYMGHTNPATTYEHYVFPKHAIGLTQEMIDRNITWDEFVFRDGKPQSDLTPFTGDTSAFKLMLAPGQSVLGDFKEEK